jgi:hypothetical protein
MKVSKYFLGVLPICFSMCNSFEKNYDPVAEIKLDIKKIIVGKDTGTLIVNVNHSSTNQTSNDFNFIVTSEAKLENMGSAKAFKYFTQESIEQKSSFCYKEIKANNNTINYRQFIFAEFNNSKDTVLLKICNNSIIKIPRTEIPCNINIAFMTFKNGSRDITLSSSQVSTNFYLTE